jgi:hypothetical protein
MARRGHTLRHGAWILALTGAIACDDSTGPLICTDQLVYGIQVEAQDSITGRGVTEGLSGTAVDGSHQETMAVLDSLVWGAPEREGMYTVTVEATGYAPWVRAGIEVEADECHVIPVELQARLQPS